MKAQQLVALCALLVSVSARASGGGGARGSGGATFELGGCENFDCPEYEAGVGQRTFQTVRMSVYLSFLGLIILYAFFQYCRSELQLQ